MTLKMVKLRQNSKKPAGATWQISDDPDQHQRWLKSGFNLGLLTGEPNDIMALDADTKDDARRIYVAHKNILTAISETRKGAHFFFRGSGPTRKFVGGDLIKGNGGFVVFPPSVVDGWTYRFVAGHGWTEELKPFPDELFVRPLAGVGDAPAKLTDKIRNVRNYIRGIRSIAGQGGHNAAFRVACILRDEKFGEADALAEMIEWNQVCAEPLWAVRDLLHKVRSAYSHATKGE